MAKRSLSQNFLKSDAALERIADAVDIREGETVLEVGPGHGELTRKLLNRGANVVAVEKDDELAAELRHIFADEIEAGKLILIHEDVTVLNLFDYSLLTTDRVNSDNDLSDHAASHVKEHGSHAASYKLVGNIPYNITGRIIRRFLTAKHQPSRMVLLVQKEVAERVTTLAGKESLLSVSVKAYGMPRMAGTVKAGSFRPQPKVDSAILVVEGISRDFFSGIEEERFFELLHVGFREKRKQLLSKLQKAYPQIGERTLESCDVSRTARAEELTPEMWRCLCRALQ